MLFHQIHINTFNPVSLKHSIIKNKILFRAIFCSIIFNVTYDNTYTQITLNLNYKKLFTTKNFMKYPKIFNFLILENRRKLEELRSKHAEKLEIENKEKTRKLNM